MSSEKEVVVMPETEPTKEYEVTVIAPEGLGFGEGAISVQEQIKKGELDEESLRAAIEIIKTDNEIFAEVDAEANDDGCGDGRGTGRVYRLLDPLTNKIQEFKRSLRRAKLFGGGLVASSSMWRAVLGRPAGGETLVEDRKFMAGKLRQRNVKHGAHTDNHAEGEFCGCGAIDKYEPISGNVVKYRSNITETLKVLYDESYEENEDAVESVLNMYTDLGQEYFEGNTGTGTMKFIQKEGAIVKELEGPHLEDVVVLNDVEGTTLDQQKLREKLVAQGLSPNIQAFVVDVWRGRMYADLVADIAEEKKHGSR